MDDSLLAAKAANWSLSVGHPQSSNQLEAAAAQHRRFIAAADLGIFFRSPLYFSLSLSQCLITQEPFCLPLEVHGQHFASLLYFFLILFSVWVALRFVCPRSFARSPPVIML